MDEDSVKLRLFSLFEAAGANGLQLKQIALQTGQSLSLIRAIVDEIAEPRKYVKRNGEDRTDDDNSHQS